MKLAYKSTLTKKDRDAIAKRLAAMTEIPRGLGTEEAACSVAAINLALSGELTDRVPECMSPIIGRWIIGVQDRMPAEIRNSQEWRELLPFAAGTGRDRDFEWARFRVLVDRLPKPEGDPPTLLEAAAKCDEAAAKAKELGYLYSAERFTYAAKKLREANDNPTTAWAAWADWAAWAAWAADLGEKAEAAKTAGKTFAQFKAEVEADYWVWYDPVSVLRALIKVTPEGVAA